MHVAHVVVSNAFAGVERYLSYVAPALREVGVDVTVIGGDVERMRAEAPDVVARPGGNIAQAARELLASRPVDIVHVHMTAAEAVAALTRPLMRRPVVSTRHFAAVRGRKLAARLARPLLARSVDVQIAISEFVKASIEDDAIVILNAVPQRAAEPHDQRIVLVAQRLEREKATDIALGAWEVSGLGDEGWELVVAGDGAERVHLESAASRGVRFVGHHRDVPALMSDAALLLASAPGEPFGLSVAEAMASGLVVVAAAGGAHAETAGAVAPELLFPPGDAAAAGALLRELAHDPSRRARIGAEMRAFQRQRLSLDAHVAQLVDVYRKAMV